MSITGNEFIRGPVFVVEGLDVSVYDSLEEVTLALEGVDVEDGICSVFDADGRRITLEAVGVRRSRFIVEVGSVRMQHIEAEPGGAEELRRTLLEFGRQCDWLVNADMTLSELVTLARARR